ncbi:hypothetical protein KUCAC02_012749 [Chaenocephalus aceratus]|uniref:Uncharacterized protein n=1 Tax=Chaenocephalus aceratus TaxID=36190 RepID=A0ACB9XBK7_CHAAC|nr:hypothetical protein KUCAC02_012749 [Chaenocephalus aceratus]
MFEIEHIIIRPKSLKSFQFFSLNKTFSFRDLQLDGWRSSGGVTSVERCPPSIDRSPHPLSGSSSPQCCPLTAGPVNPPPKQQGPPSTAGRSRHHPPHPQVMGETGGGKRRDWSAQQRAGGGQEEGFSAEGGGA